MAANERFSDRVTRLMGADTKPAKEAEDAGKGKPADAAAQGMDKEKGEGKEKGAESGAEKKPGEEKETPEPPAPTAKTEEELKQPPEAFLESGVDKKLVEQMGAKDEPGAKEAGAQKEQTHATDQPQAGIADRPTSRSFADVSKELRGAGVASLAFREDDPQRPAAGAAGGAKA